jgi:hypothetical protein
VPYAYQLYVVLRVVLRVGDQDGPVLSRPRLSRALVDFVNHRSAELQQRLAPLGGKRLTDTGDHA